MWATFASLGIGDSLVIMTPWENKKPHFAGSPIAFAASANRFSRSVQEVAINAILIVETLKSALALSSTNDRRCPQGSSSNFESIERSSSPFLANLLCNSSIDSPLK